MVGHLRDGSVRIYRDDPLPSSGGGGSGLGCFSECCLVNIPRRSAGSALKEGCLFKACGSSAVEVPAAAAAGSAAIPDAVAAGWGSFGGSLGFAKAEV